MATIPNMSFTAGGIDVRSIVDGLMQVERAPLTRIQSRQQFVQRQLASLSAVRTDLDALRTAAAGLLTGGLTKVGATSTSSAASATVTAGAGPGSISFTVDRVAQAHGLRTATTVAGATSAITTASVLAISSTTAPLGIDGVAAGAGLATGPLDVSVTKATAGATRTGTTAVTFPLTVVAGVNDTLTMEVDGVARTVTIAAGTYDRTGLATALGTALSGAGAAVSASIDTTGAVRLTTTHEGSAATLRLTGGNALADLGLGVDAVALTGTDGEIRINGTTTTVTSAAAGTTVAAATGAGTLDLRLGGGLRVGDAKVAVVSTGDRSLSAVTTAINAAKVGVSAAAVKLADGQWLLQLTSTRSGTAGAIAVDTTAFGPGGGLVATSAAQDARITVGSGPGAYSIDGDGNTFANVLAGAVITTTATSATPVTVTVARDDAAIADAVGQLVTKANTLLAQISTQTKYDTTTKIAGPLSGESSVKRLADDLRRAVTSIVSGASTPLASSVGITTKRDGSLAFDRQQFLSVLQSDPTAVERLFGRGGSSTGGVSWAGASDVTKAGAYAVQVTTAATRATSGDVLTGGAPGGREISVRIGNVTVAYAAVPWATTADIAAGLDAALASAGLAVKAEESGGGIRLTATTYGVGGTFEYNLDSAGAGTWTSVSGTDVVGTIDGQAAVGVGQRLRLLDTATSDARGLAVDVGEGLTGSLGPVSYEPGIAARLTLLGTTSTAENGPLTTAGNGLKAREQAFTQQIDRFEARMERVEKAYLRQWSALQGVLQSLQNQGNWLDGQLAGLSKS